jgi:hypothetical protein
VIGSESVPHPLDNPPTIEALHRFICECKRCPRLVAWTEEIARTKVARFKDFDYWGKPVPSLGRRRKTAGCGISTGCLEDRTGRIFTGDRSGEWLCATPVWLPISRFDRNDALKLVDCYITAVLHCAHP